MAKKAVIPEAVIVNKIYLIRGQKVMLDSELAELYGVETKQLKRQVRRNQARFPSDFMFELSREELKNLRSQIGTSSWGGTRFVPMAFTEQGVAMLSSILHSEQAIEINIFIIRVFTKLREMVLSNKDILLKLEQMEQAVSKHDENIEMIFSALKELLNTPPVPRQRIGFKVND